MKTLRDITLGDMLRYDAEHFAGRPAIEYCGRTVTYESLLQRVSSIARGYMALGLHKGSHIGIWDTDRPNALCCIYAAAYIGAVAVLFNTSLKKREMDELAAGTDIDLMMYGDGYKDSSFTEIIHTLEGFRSPERLCYIGEAGAEEDYTLDMLIKAGQSVGETALQEAASSVEPSDGSMIIFTSGTTGPSKPVLLTHYSQANLGANQAADQGATSRDKFMITIPMFHCFSLAGNIIAALSVGACVYFPGNRRTDSILRGVSESKCTVMSGVPTMFHALICNANIDSYDVSSLRIGLVGGGGWGPEMFREVRKKLGYELLPSLGMSEMGGGITVGSVMDSEEAKTTTAGHFMDFIDYKFTDSEGRPCGEHEIGEICVKGYNLMQGYFGREDETHKAIDEEGFYHTGDMGYIDDHGNVHLTGRKKDIIIRGGENIYPGEIEDCIREMDGILDCKVIGLPDLHYGEITCAAVICRGEPEMPEADIRKYVGKRLAYYKKPDKVIFIREFPKLGNGKISVSGLKELATTIIEGEKL